LRVQQGAITIRTSLGAAEPSLKLFENLKRAEIFSDFELSKIDVAHEGFVSVVTASGISLTYKNSKSPAVKDIDFTIAEGESVAIVGASGAGKTTLIDLLLGILEPDSGGIEISGLAPIDAIRTWPGSVAYVPQDILIIDGTIRQNVTMGYPPKLIHDELVWSALAMASLEDYVRKLPNGLDTSVGDRGVNLSGGERQRLGIARAMFTRPKLLVFDEATSALDGQTEAEVTSSIQSLHGRVTVILIAHRLSSVQKADRVFYMSEGKIIAEGNFAHVRSQVPNFDEQARLMGL
jgi:ABC-type multidrug transport system fused ATPase/permease subunit